MGLDRLNMEEAAAESFVALMKQAKKCVELYTRARMALPEPLQRMVGIENDGSDQSATAIALSKLLPHSIGVDAGWICIDPENATPTSIVLAVLQGAAAPMKTNELAARIASVRSGISHGVINNIGTRLDESLISRSRAGWQLIKQERSPVLRGGLICGPPAIFSQREIAVHRRHAILLLLRQVEGGLTISQLTHLLKDSASVHAPVEKRLIEGDVQALSCAGLIGRSDSNKWTINPASANHVF
jgi:hypothetical protein